MNRLFLAITIACVILTMLAIMVGCHRCGAHAPPAKPIPVARETFIWNGMSRAQFAKASKHATLIAVDDQGEQWRFGTTTYDIVFDNGYITQIK